MGSSGLKDIHLRDPFVLLDQGRYYLYGTRGATVWTEADGFDCYTSDDLVEWSGPARDLSAERGLLGGQELSGRLSAYCVATPTFWWPLSAQPRGGLKCRY